MVPSHSLVLVRPCLLRKPSLTAQVKWGLHFIFYLMLLLLLIFYFYLFIFLKRSFFVLFFVISWAAPAAYEGSQARGPIRAVATGLRQSHSNVRSEPRLRPTPQLTETPDR